MIYILYSTNNHYEETGITRILWYILIYFILFSYGCSLNRDEYGTYEKNGTFWCPEESCRNNGTDSLKRDIPVCQATLNKTLCNYCGISTENRIG